MIGKTAVASSNFYTPLFFYESARAAFSEILEHYHHEHHSTLLLPGYIGFSLREGSGIYDPVVQSGISHIFYPVDDKLNIDCSRFEAILNAASGHIIVLLVHYFGYPDKELPKIVNLCRAKGAVIIEDAAHALFSEFVDHCVGHYGDFVLYSLHKMLPFPSGGMLKMNTLNEMFLPQQDKAANYSPFSYDLYGIAQKRKNNAKLWNDLLHSCNDKVETLRPFTEDVTAQTFPIIVRNFDRNELYFKLNDSGYGAVSLYHTMVAPIQNENFEKAVWLSQHIINLPVHQDTDPHEIVKMADLLQKIIR